MGGEGRKSFSSWCGLAERPSPHGLGTRAGQGAHPLTLLGVGHAPPLQHQLEVLGGRVAARGQPLEPADSGQLGQRPELLPQHVLQHFGRRGDQEARQGVHGGARDPRAAQAFHRGHLRPHEAREAAGGGAWTTCSHSPARLLQTGPALRKPVQELCFNKLRRYYGEHNYRQYWFSNWGAHWNRLGSFVCIF